MENKLIIGLLIVTLIIGGIYSMRQLPVDAVPDITNNQVQIVTTSGSLAPQEVEQLITFPVEMAMANLPDVEEIRSISRFGLSVVTVVFEEDVPIMKARQFVSEQISIAQQEIPQELGVCEMMPITTGLGEIYQYTLQVDSSYADQYSPMELRTIQDWIVKRQLAGTEGIIEVSSFGGFLKQYEVALDPVLLAANNTTVSEVYDALEKNNQNTGGSYIEKGDNAYYIRTEGLIKELDEIDNIRIKTNGETPVFVRNVGKTRFGHPPRYGAMTMDGNGEVVGGITLMLKGANSSDAIYNVQQRVEMIQKSLPKGVRIVPYLDRSVLVGKAINTVSKNLIEGGLIVILVLILLLGNFRAGLIVASVIPLSLLFAFICMQFFGVSANLMSLGAIDFGIVVDGAVIIVEGVLHLLYARFIGKKLSRSEMNTAVSTSASSIISSAAFGVLIIIVVFIPIMTLTGIEGKMFTPMAKTVSFAIIGALLLSVTYVPMMSALILKRDIKATKTFSDKIIEAIQSVYRPALQFVLRFPRSFVMTAAGLLVATVFVFLRMGGEFIPTLDEGDLAMQVNIEPGSSLTKMIKTTTNAEAILLKEFPEVKHVVSKIGTAEVPTDPMAVEDADVMILLKERDDWVSAQTREELADKMKEALSVTKDVSFEFTQPIQLRFNELISGSKSDVVIKLYGEDLNTLAQKGKEIESIVKSIDGAGDVKIEQTEGLPQVMIKFNREKLALHGIDVEDANSLVRTAYAGETVGTVYEGERRFDLTLRLDNAHRGDVDLSSLFMRGAHGVSVPLSELAELKVNDGPMQISREDAKRRIAVGVNIRNRDVASFIEEAQHKLDADLSLPPGYLIEYGGQFENLQAASDRLKVAVPIALGLILVLLFFAFSSLKYAFMIFVTVPLSAIGGVFALVLRDMPFSISAGVGFIALFGVAVLNGIVLISYFNRLKEEESETISVVLKGALLRLRPVLMTAAVASFGFLPMAISTSAGAEVQKPLATVVIGGLITATFLTLFILPALYYLVERKSKRVSKVLPITLLFIGLSMGTDAQELTEQMAIDSMLANNSSLKNAALNSERVSFTRRSHSFLGSTDLSFQYGQMNTLEQDRYISIGQVINNPFSTQAKRAVGRAQVELAELEEELLRASFLRDVKISYSDWSAAYQKSEVLARLIEMVKESIQDQSLKNESGEISKTDLVLSQTLLYDLELQLLEERKAYLNAKNQLLSLCMIRSDVIPVTEPYEPDITLTMAGNDSASILLVLTDKRLDIAEGEHRASKMDLLPNFSVSYFDQTLDLEKGFRGFGIGLEVPLFDRQKHMAIRESGIRADIATNLTEQQKFANALEVNQLRDKMNELNGLYVALSGEFDQDIETFVQHIELVLNNGEIDRFTYTQMMSKKTEFVLKVIDLENDLKKTQAQLNYLTTQSIKTN